MCLTTRGVTVMEPMRRVVCLCAWSTNQNKALTGAQFSCGAASLCCPARPGTFLITIQSLSVYTISGAEWTVAQGSPWEALQSSAPPCPAVSLPPLPLSTLPPPTTPPQQQIHIPTNTQSRSRLLLSPTHNWSHGRVCYFSPLLISNRYWSLLWLEYSTIGALLTVLKTNYAHRLDLPIDSKKPWSSYSVWTYFLSMITIFSCNITDRKPDIVTTFDHISKSIGRKREDLL